MNQFCQWAEWPECPKGFRLPPPEEHVANPLPEGMNGVRRLLEVCGTQDETIVVSLCGGLGLRIGEACGLPASALKVHAKRIRIVGKGDHVRTLPVNDGIWGLLLSRAIVLDFNDEPMVTTDKDRARRSITRLGREARLSVSVASHMLRATFATDLYRRSKDILLVMKYLGHKDPATTMKYLGVDLDEMRGAAPVLFGLTPSVVDPTQPTWAPAA